ncbi:MAG: hypothetical protein LUH14_09630, partial [Clostridiaceae bacterium]|nr:hypothetical protein [Clostridiaceae bacterium]
LMLAIWLFTASLLGNILSILFGSIYGMVFTLALQIFSILSLMWVDTNNLDTTEVMKLISNYSAHLVFSWHKWGGTEIVKMDELNAHISFGVSFLFLAAAAAVVMFGMIVISKIDIIQENREG